MFGGVAGQGHRELHQLLRGLLIVHVNANPDVVNDRIPGSAGAEHHRGPKLIGNGRNKCHTAGRRVERSGVPGRNSTNCHDAGPDQVHRGPEHQCFQLYDGHPEHPECGLCDGVSVGCLGEHAGAGHQSSRERLFVDHPLSLRDRLLQRRHSELRHQQYRYRVHPTGVILPENILTNR